MGEEKQIIMYANLPEPQKLIAEKATGEYHLIAHSEGLVSMTVNLPSNVNSVVDFYFNRHIHKEVQAVNGVVTLVAIKSEDGDVEFPTEILREPGFTVSIIYENENNQITTNYVFFPVYTNGIGEEPLHYDDDSYIDAKIAREAAEEALQEISELEPVVGNMSEELEDAQVDITTLQTDVDILKNRTPFWGNTGGLYIDAQNGNDENKGTESQPVQTLKKAIDIINAEGQREYNFIFMTSDTYVVPNNYPVISNYPIHFYNYKTGTDSNGADVYSMPTILFERDSSAVSAPRFYNSQIHFEGMKIKSGNDYLVYPVKIGCTWGHLYFENCSTYIYNTEFLCPVSFYRCQMENYNCSYSDNISGSEHLQDYQLHIRDSIGSLAGYTLFKGTTTLPARIIRSHMTLFTRLTLTEQAEHYRDLNFGSSSLSQQIIKLESATCYINEYMIPKYFKTFPNLPYQVKSNNEFVDVYSAGGETDTSTKNGWSGATLTTEKVFNSYDYIINANFSHIETVRSFYRSVNRSTTTTQYSPNSYNTDKIYLDHTSLYADGFPLHPDHPEQDGNYDEYITTGFISNNGQNLHLCFNMPGYYSNYTNFPQIIIPLTTATDILNPMIVCTGISAADGIFTNLKTKLTNILTPASNYDRDGITYYAIQNRLSNNSYNPQITFQGSQILANIKLTTSTTEFAALNNQPITFWFGPTYIKWVNGAPTSTTTALYSNPGKTTLETTIPAGTTFYIDGWQYSGSRHGSCTIDGTTYTGYIDANVLPHH